MSRISNFRQVLLRSHRVSGLLGPLANSTRAVSRTAAFRTSRKSFFAGRDSILVPRLPQLLVSSRPFFGWLNSIFNKYDVNRVKEVGPDRACAEWCLRCGAAVRWKSSKSFLKDYNSLPVGASRSLKIVEIDATDSGVMEAGFPYLHHLTDLTRIKFRNCVYLTDDSLAFLDVARCVNLESLELSFNGNFTDRGLHRLTEFKQLKVLHLEELQGVDKPKELLDYLQEHLPDCKISFPPHTTSAST